jgi:hypothetical protein
MIKHVFVGFLNGISEIESERWYLRFHSKEVVRFFGPWLRRYESYRAYEPPPEARRFGAVGSRMTELWYASVEDFIEAKPNSRPYTFAPWFATAPPHAIATGVTIVPAMPTEDFLGKEPTPEERHILRWYCLIKYPDGISLEEREMVPQCSFTRGKASDRSTQICKPLNHRKSANQDSLASFGRAVYEDFAAWRKAVIDAPPHYTPPPWTKEEPFIDSVSNLIKYKPDIDFLKDNPIIP